jgi:hypothetical protein
MIDETKVVDLVGISDEDNYAIMIIIDHFDWGEHDDWHLNLLQDKLNYYLAVLESGEFYEKFPKTKTYKIIIEVTGTYPLNKDAEEFYEKAKRAINGFGFELIFRISSSQMN